jgi:hypothetical protein
MTAESISFDNRIDVSLPTRHSLPYEIRGFGYSPRDVISKYPSESGGGNPTNNAAAIRCDSNGNRDVWHCGTAE